MKAKLNQRKKAGVKSRNKIRLTVFQKDILFNISGDLVINKRMEGKQGNSVRETNREKARDLDSGSGESAYRPGECVRVPTAP